MRVTHGPKENRFRPAIDPLFRSAAYAYGPQVIGVILTGLLDDGTSGLWAVKDRTGVAVVQDPLDALYPSMPSSALQYVDVDHCLCLAEIAPLLMQLVSEPVIEQGGAAMSDALTIETQIAREDNALQAGVLQLGQLSPYTCPDCHGTMVQVQEDKIQRFRCHTGHAFSMESLLTAITESIEETLWDAVRVLEERIFLLRHMAQHAWEQQDETLFEQFEQKAQAAEQQAQILRAFTLAQVGVAEKQAQPSTH
jgi:two-component system chemotaxis response regulator CheB